MCKGLNPSKQRLSNILHHQIWKPWLSVQPLHELFSALLPALEFDAQVDPLEHIVTWFPLAKFPVHCNKESIVKCTGREFCIWCSGFIIVRLCHFYSVHTEMQTANKYDSYTFSNKYVSLGEQKKSNYTEHLHHFISPVGRKEFMEYFGPLQFKITAN